MKAWSHCLSILVPCLGFAILEIGAHAAPGYAVSATKVTMPASGTATSKYTVTGIPMAGNLSLNCAYSGPQTEAHLPVCDGGPAEEIPVAAGQSVSGLVVFYPYGSAIPAEKRPHQAAATGLALGGLLLLGFGFRRRARRWFVLALVGLSGLAGGIALTACGGMGNGSTPGTYQYSIAAGDAGLLNPLVTQATTTVTVTVP
jgi:hypothetical protein